MSTLLGDRYRLDTLIGGGGMGEVWEAHDAVLDRTVAIKVIRQHLADDETIRARLRVEARLAGSLHHPGIVDVFDYGEDEVDGRTVPYLVMPLIDGSPLSAVLAERGSLSTGETMAVVSEVAAALHVAHEAGIVHRDLKPGNILVTPDGRLMLVDFGIARASDGEPLTQTGTLVGTADYLSPEQASGRPATPASDLYSLGVVAHTCLTGSLPFHRDSSIATALAQLRDEPPPLPADVPADPAGLVSALLAKKPHERPASAAVVAGRAARSATSVPAPAGGAPAEVAGTVTAALAPVSEAATGGSVVAAEQADGRSPRRLVLLGSALAVIAAVALGWLLLDGGEVVVPDVVGQTQQAATARLEGLKLEVDIRKVDVAEHGAGQVVDQNPAASEQVDEGATITLSVASGRVRVPVDQITGRTYQRGVSVLDTLGLKSKAVYRTSSEPAGTVIDVDPSTTAKIGGTVTLTVATGAAPGQGRDKGDKSGKDTGDDAAEEDGGTTGEGEPSPTPTTTSPPTSSVSPPAENP